MQFFLTVGVITTLIIYMAISYFAACVLAGCYDKCREHFSDYHYDLNTRSQLKAIGYAICGGLIVAFIFWLSCQLFPAIAEVL